MSRRGPLPKPKAVRLLEGSYRPGRDGEGLEIPEGAPSIPEWLTPQERVIFDATLSTLARVPGLVTLVDAAAIARYAADWATYLKARDTIDHEGEDVTTDKGAVYQHPAVGRMNKAHERMMKFEARFAMTPADRASIGRSVQPKKAVGVATRQRVL